MGIQCRTAILCAVLTTMIGASAAHAESMHVFGIHHFGWGANSNDNTGVDVMNHRTGWALEFGLTGGGGLPDVAGRHRAATANGFTIIQRLDWTGEYTVPITESEQNQFAQQCANWATMLQKYCRHYLIGNEMELWGPVSASQYVSAFTKVRNAIKAVQPDAIVIIGHFTNDGNLRTAIQALGPNGYDGVAAHTGSSVPTGRLNMLDEENARPEVGVYVSEWGWLVNTGNPASIVSFYNALAQSNSSRDRQVYAATWFVYPTNIGWDTFALQNPVASQERQRFREAVALGTAVNPYAANPVLISNLYADVPDSGTSITVSWNTNVPARNQLWWTPVNPPGNPLHYTAITDLSDTLSTSHQIQILTAAPNIALTPNTGVTIMPSSPAKDHGDAGGRRYNVKSGPWLATATQSGVDKMLIEWSTDWPMDSRVDYGPTPALGQTALNPVSTTSHAVELDGLSTGDLYYRILSSEPNPYGGPRMYMRSPVRNTIVGSFHPGDFNDDGIVDMTDYGYFQACYSGTGNPQTDPDCAPARLAGNDHVDQNDFLLFQGCMSGAGIPSDQYCLQ